jgi:integrase
VIAALEKSGQACFWGLAAIKVIALCAGRVSEVLSLRYDQDLFLDEGYALLREHKTAKKQGSKHLELPPEAIAIIKGLPKQKGNPWVFPGSIEGRSYTRHGVYHIWKQVCALAKVNDLHMHDFRSFAASEGLEQGIDSRTAAKLLGHSSSRTTEKHYLKVRQRKMAEAAAQIARPIAEAFKLKNE